MVDKDYKLSLTEEEELEGEELGEGARQSKDEETTEEEEPADETLGQ